MCVQLRAINGIIEGYGIAFSGHGASSSPSLKLLSMDEIMIIIDVQVAVLLPPVRLGWSWSRLVRGEPKRHPSLLSRLANTSRIAFFSFLSWSFAFIFIVLNWPRSTIPCEVWQKMYEISSRPFRYRWDALFHVSLARSPNVNQSQLIRLYELHHFLALGVHLGEWISEAYLRGNGNSTARLPGRRQSHFFDANLFVQWSATFWETISALS